MFVMIAFLSFIVAACAWRVQNNMNYQDSDTGFWVTFSIFFVASLIFVIDVSVLLYIHAP